LAFDGLASRLRKRLDFVAHDATPEEFVYWRLSALPTLVPACHPSISPMPDPATSFDAREIFVETVLDERFDG